MKNEIDIHLELNENISSSIIFLYHTFEDESNLYLLLEHCEGQELYQLIKQHKVKGQLLPEPDISKIFSQIAKGVNHMQSQGVMHRDLKLGNILISPTKAVKIIDFGLAVRLEIGEKGEQKTLCGTPNYISPEILNSQPYGLQSDLWSLGCILYALLTGTPPFECPSVQDTLLKIRKGKFKLPDHMSDTVQDLVTKLLNSDPENRITI